MTGYKSVVSLIIFLVSLFSVQAFSQQSNFRDSLGVDNPQKEILKPLMHYSLGSTFMFIPHFGSVSGYTITPSLSVPLSPKLSVDGGIIAGRYYSAIGSSTEGGLKGEFNELSIFGSASYHVNPRLTLYGIGIKQITGNSPFVMLPKSSCIIGSNYNFGTISVGVSVQVSKWNNDLSRFPFSDTPGFYSPSYPGPGTFLPSGR